VQVATAGEPFADYATAWGATAQAVATTDESLLVWGDTPVTTTVEATTAGEADAGAEVGAATVTAGQQTVRIPLALDRAIPGPDGWWRLGNPGELLG
jgi:D-alanyl-D-alanine carboxypeptidase (penicillin-binding protein 5/6)